jgi:hypothetical protein
MFNTDKSESVAFFKAKFASVKYWLQPLTEMSTMHISWGVKAAGA